MRLYHGKKGKKPPGEKRRWKAPVNAPLQEKKREGETRSHVLPLGRGETDLQKRRRNAGFEYLFCSEKKKKKKENGADWVFHSREQKRRGFSRKEQPPLAQIKPRERERKKRGGKGRVWLRFG